MRRQKRGFTLIELLVVLGIMAVIILAGYPSILKMLATRDLENATRDIQASLQVAKFQAVKTKLNHRVRFDNAHGPWTFIVERQETSGTWVNMHGAVAKALPSNSFVVTVHLPASQDIVFNSLGIVQNFIAGQNSIAIQSLKLAGSDFDMRTVSFFLGGSIRYEKSKSE